MRRDLSEQQKKKKKGSEPFIVPEEHWAQVFPVEVTGQPRPPIKCKTKKAHLSGQEGHYKVNSAVWRGKRGKDRIVVMLLCIQRESIHVVFHSEPSVRC